MIAHVDAVQNRHTAMGREADDVVAWCEANQVPFFAYSPLRSSVPAPRLAAIATGRGVSLQRLQLAALLHSSPVVSVISGATRPQTALDSIAAEHEPWNAELRTAYEADLA